MFRLTIKKRIHSCFAGSSSSDAIMVRKYTLPFAPSIGLELLQGDWSSVINEICYDVDLNVFYCWVGSDEEFYVRGLHSDEFHFAATKEEMNAKIEKYKQEGWEQER
jgi:hypothetical protein